MTGTRDPQQDGSIQAMLRDSGLEASTELRSSLEELRALVPDKAPAPRAELAALLAAGAHGPATAVISAVESLPAGVTSLAGRRGRKRRLAIVGGAVVGAMTLGAGAVAASSEDFRERVSHTVGIIFQPSGETPDVAPKPVRPSPADVPAAPAPAPSDAASATTPPTAAAAPEAPESAAAFPAKPGAAATATGVGRGGVLPAPPHRPATPGLPGFPGLGDGKSLPVSPLPAPPLPSVIPTKLPGQP